MHNVDGAVHLRDGDDLISPLNGNTLNPPPHTVLVGLVPGPSVPGTRLCAGVFTWEAIVIARAVASPSTSSGRHISWPSGPVIPRRIIFADCYMTDKAPVASQLMLWSVRGCTYHFNEVTVLTMNQGQCPQLLAASEHMVHLEGGV